MGKVSFKYGTASQLTNAPYSEGTFYVISDSGSTDGILYADLNSKRICFGDVASLEDDVSELASSIPTKISELVDDSDFIKQYYGTCGTAAATVQKEVTINSITELTTGLTIFVKFTYANSAANPILKLNNFDAKYIKRYGTTAPSTSAASSWNAGGIVSLTYDGTYWYLNDWNNTTYSAMSESEMQTGTATTGRNITAARLKEAIEYHAPVKSVNGQTGEVTINIPTVPTNVSEFTNDSGYLIEETDPTIHILTLYKNENEELTTREDESISDYVYNSNNKLVVIYHNGKPYFYDKASDRGLYFDGIDGSYLRYYQNNWQIDESYYVYDYDIPSNVSQLNNDAGYLTSYTETDPTVPSWAKQSTKPTYTATEVGALPDTTVIPEDKVFIATYGTTTYADTLSAYNAGKLIFAVYNDTTNGKTILPLTRKSSSTFQFEGQYLNGLTSRPFYSLSSSGWTKNNTYGNIIDRNADITSGDRLIIRDIDDNNTTKSSSLTFGTATNQYLANNGTWQTVPENVSDLTNDSGYLTEETDPTVPSWAKASTKPSYNFSEIGLTPTTISGYGITDAYTKTQIDGLVAGVLHYKGTKAAVSNLPTSGNTTGDTWHITADGSEWAWDGTTWQELGTAVDLSNYVTTDDSRLSDARTPTAHNQALSTITGADDLKAIEALSGTSGLLKKTAANTWTLDTSNYLTSYTETDPVFSASAAAGITSTDISNWNSKTSNTGTVTSVGLTNATDGGLTISGSPVTNLGNITVGHSNVLSSAQTTQAVYPIKIDKNGHISAYGAAVTITDEKVKQIPLNGSSSSKGLLFNKSTGANETTDTIYTSNKIMWNDYVQELYLYNSDRNKYGTLSYRKLYLGNNSTDYHGTLTTADITANTSYILPNKSGTVALTSDIPDVSGYINKSGDTMNGRLILNYNDGAGGLRIYGLDETYTDIQDLGYAGNTTNYTPILKFRSGKSNTANSNQFRVLLEGIANPTSNDDAANKEYVDNAIPKVYSSTNTSGYLTMATLPIYDGTVV